MYQGLVFSCAILTSALVLLLFRKHDKGRNIFLKVLTVVFCAVGFFRFLLSDSIIFFINGGWFEDTFYEQTDIWHLILRWGYFTNYAVLPMAVFFKNRFFRNVAGCLSFPFAILSTVFFDRYMEFFLSKIGKGLHFTPTFRYVYFCVELTLALAIPLILLIGEKHVFRFKDPKEWINLITGLPFVILAMIPAYFMQGVVGTNVRVPQWFSTYHFVWLGVTVAIIIVLYYKFRFKDLQTRRALCMFLILVLFYQYNSLYLMGITLKRLPFQLCNIASFMLLIAFVFDLKKMFHFCFIANMVGTIFAMVAPDFNVGYTGFWNCHFLIQHSYVLIIPAVCMGLRLFPRISKRSIGYYFIGFTAYISFCYVLGTVLNGYSDITGERVNYFYMFDFETAFDYFPFLKFVENYKIEYGRFVMYPLVFVIVYVGYSALSMLFYLLVKLIYRMEDDLLDMRLSAIDLYEKITKKPSRFPRSYID